MLSRKYTLLPLLCLFHLCQPARSQSIKGDTIYVNTEVEVAIRFPERPENFSTLPSVSDINLRSLSTGFTLIAKKKFSKPITLFVIEGKRSHHFFVFFKKDINYANIAEIDYDYSTVKKLEAHVRQKIAESEAVKNYEDIITAANASLDAKNYEQAIEGYKKALAIRPNDKYVQKQLDKANKGLNGGSRKKIKGNNPDEPAEKNRPAYTAEDLKKYYPAIDFSKPPPEQKFDLMEAYDPAKEMKYYPQVMQAEPRLDISAKDNRVKLTCRAISFSEKRVYIDLLISNSSKNDFLTGMVNLFVKGASGTQVGYYPLFVYPSPLPVIQPGNESRILVISQAMGVDDKESLILNLTDRLNKTELKLSIKGTAYNEEYLRSGTK